MTVVMIRQPGYLPYLGFFKKIQTSDVFVYLDDVQYSVRDGDNRNKIRTNKGTTYLTVPLIKPFGKKINEVNIANSIDWKTQHKNTIKAYYSCSPFFKKYWDSIESILNADWEKLIDINLEFIEYFKKILNLKTKCINSSELNIPSTKSQRILDICKKLNATTYVSGELGRNYLDEKMFHDAGIEVLYEKFQHPVYKQQYSNFIPYLSVIDLVFNEGDNATKILDNSTNL